MFFAGLVVIFRGRIIDDLHAIDLFHIPFCQTILVGTADGCPQWIGFWNRWHRL